MVESVDRLNKSIAAIKKVMERGKTGAKPTAPVSPVEKKAAPVPTSNDPFSVFTREFF